MPPLRLAVALVAASVLCAQPGKVTHETIRVDGQPRKYFLFVSKDIPSPAPLLVLLHGSGHNGSSLIEPWKKLASREGIILVAPDSLNPAGWVVPTDGPDFLHDVVEDVKRVRDVDPRRVWLFGHSAGAVFALYMSCLESEYFAATAIHAGAFPDARDSRLVKVAPRKIPIHMIVGTRDAFFPLVNVRATHSYLAAAGFPVDLNEISGHDHNYYVVSGNINKEVWEFLRDKKLPSDPKYQAHQFTR